MAGDDGFQQQLLKEFREAESAHYRECRMNKTSACYYVSSKKHTVSEFNRDALIAQFKSEGLKIRHGRWTLQEKKLLNKNFEDFVKQNEKRIGDPVDFVTTSSDKARAYEVLKLKGELDYIESLAKGLYRTRAFVWKIAVSTLDPLAVSNKQAYSVEDLKLLKTLIDRFGKNWRLISKEIGRSTVSVHGAFRNYLRHEEYGRTTPSKKQKRKLAKEMTKRYPEHDFSTMLVHGVPWDEIAMKIGFMHGQHLAPFWERIFKYHTEDGKLKFAKTSKLPDKLVRKFIRVATKKAPTHLDALDWDFFYAMFEGKVAGVVHMKQIIPKMLRKYKINDDEIGLAAALVKLRKILKQQKKLGFQSVWDEMKKGEKLQVVRWQQYHWALSPDLAHYVQNRPVMYWGYQEDHSDVVKSEPVDDPDIVW